MCIVRGFTFSLFIWALCNFHTTRGAAIVKDDGGFLQEIQGPTLSLTRRDTEWNERKQKQCTMCLNAPLCKKYKACDSCQVYCNKLQISISPLTTEAPVSKSENQVSSSLNEADILVGSRHSGIPELPSTTEYLGSFEIVASLLWYYAVGVVESGPLMDLLIKLFNVPTPDNFEKFILVGQLKTTDTNTSSIDIVDLVNAFKDRHKVTADIHKFENKGDPKQKDVIGFLNTNIANAIKHHQEENGNKTLNKTEINNIFSKTLTDLEAEERQSEPKCSELDEELINMLPSYGPERSNPLIKTLPETESDIKNPPVIQDNFVGLQAPENDNRITENQVGKQLEDGWVNDNDERSPEEISQTATKDKDTLLVKTDETLPPTADSLVGAPEPIDTHLITEVLNNQNLQQDIENIVDKGLETGFKVNSLSNLLNENVGTPQQEIAASEIIPILQETNLLQTDTKITPQNNKPSSLVFTTSDNNSNKNLKDDLVKNEAPEVIVTAAEPLDTEAINISKNSIVENSILGKYPYFLSKPKNMQTNLNSENTISKTDLSSHRYPEVLSNKIRPFSSDFTKEIAPPSLTEEEKHDDETVLQSVAPNDFQLQSMPQEENPGQVIGSRFNVVRNDLNAFVNNEQDQALLGKQQETEKTTISKNPSEGMSLSPELVARGRGKLFQELITKQQHLPSFGSLVPSQDPLSPKNNSYHKVYFVGEDINLPLHMFHDENGVMKLKVDTGTLCNCKNCSRKHVDSMEMQDGANLGTSVQPELNVRFNRNEDLTQELENPLHMQNEHSDIFKRSPLMNNEIQESSEQKIENEIQKLNEDIEKYDEANLDLLIKSSQALYKDLQKSKNIARMIGLTDSMLSLMQKSAKKP